MNIFEGTLEKLEHDAKIAIVVAKFNESITGNLLKGAFHTLEQYGVAPESVTVCWTPGAFEIPLVAERLASCGEFEAIICLGAVIKGETSHDEHINRAVSLSLMRIGIDLSLPIIFGVLTCNTLEQAIARSGGTPQSRDKATDGAKAGNKGSEAAEAAIMMIRLLDQLPESASLGQDFLETMMSGPLGLVGGEDTSDDEPFWDEEDVED
jgi:6,7-dimethyl-8-ribityllumazine synthase